MASMRPTRPTAHEATRKMIESNRKKEPPSGVTKENRTEQEMKSMDERSEMKIGPTKAKNPSQHENSGEYQNGKGGGDVDFIPRCKTQQTVQACLVIDVPHLNQTGDMGDQET